MWWQYLLVFLGAFAFDVTPFPLPPAFTIMIFLQLLFGLDIWWVITVGVSGSILGRYLLTLYIPMIAERIFIKSKNDDVRFLGQQLQEKGWKSQVAILAYTLLPLPTTPLFIASGIARVNSARIIPVFFAGKFTSDAITVYLGRYASENAGNIISRGFSWQAIASLILGFLFLAIVLFVDWRSLIQRKKLMLNFRI